MPPIDYTIYYLYSLNSQNIVDVGIIVLVVYFNTIIKFA